MRKQELIHLHGLFSEIASHCTDNGVDVDREDYRELGTRPTSIQHSKTDHGEAVFTLTKSITSALPVDSPATESASANTSGHRN